MPGVRDAAQPTRSGGRPRCPRQSQPVILIIQPAERVLFSDTRAPTRSRASNAQDWFESFTLIGSSESSRENSGKIFDLFSPPGPSWSPNSAPKAVLCSSARRAASSYPWPSRTAAQDRAFRIGCVTIHANSEPVDRRRVSLPLCISKWALRSLISFIQQGR